MKKKILITTSILLATATFGGLLGWGIDSNNKLKVLREQPKITQEQVDKAYNDGFNDGLTSNEQVDALISSYRENILELNGTISQLTNQVTTLTQSNTNYQAEITQLKTQAQENESTIEALQATINSNNETIANNEAEINTKTARIAELENQIAELQTQLEASNSNNESLSAQLETKTNEALNLQSQVATLQAENIRLTNENADYLSTIETLNADIASKQQTIDSLTATNQQNAETIESLNNQINSLNSQIETLNARIAELEERVWKLEGVPVVFLSGNNIVATQTIAQGGTPTAPEEPVPPTGYAFAGWTKDGETLVDLSTETLEVATNYQALFFNYTTTEDFYITGFGTSFEEVPMDRFHDYKGKLAFSGGWLYDRTTGGLKINEEVDHYNQTYECNFPEADVDKNNFFYDADGEFYYIYRSGSKNYFYKQNPQTLAWERVPMTLSDGTALKTSAGKIKYWGGNTYCTYDTNYEVLYRLDKSTYTWIPDSTDYGDLSNSLGDKYYLLGLYYMNGDSYYRNSKFNPETNKFVNCNWNIDVGSDTPKFIDGQNYILVNGQNYVYIKSTNTWQEFNFNFSFTDDITTYNSITPCWLHTDGVDIYYIYRFNLNTSNSFTKGFKLTKNYTTQIS